MSLMSSTGVPHSAKQSASQMRIAATLSGAAILDPRRGFAVETDGRPSHCWARWPPRAPLSGRLRVVVPLNPRPSNYPPSRCALDKQSEKNDPERDPLK